jgi:glycosyltransferase involved in cell wall biosynthesis
MSSGRATVIVPTYKHQDYLRCSILSILNSTIPVEVIIVPVVFDKPTLEELDRLKGSFDGRVSVIVSDKADVFHQMQLGLENCRTEFFSVLGSDDYLLPNCIQRMLQLADESKAENPIVGLSYAITDEHLNITRIETLRPFSFRRMMKGIGVIPDASLVRTENAQAVGGFLNNGKDFGYLSHFALQHKLLKLPGTKVIIRPELGLLYRQLPNSRHLTRYTSREAIRLHHKKAREVADYYWRN